MEELETLNELRECRRCARRYLEINNLGVWACRCHWGTRNTVWNDGTLFTWTCCGRPIVDNPLRTHADNGCTRCDHVWEVHSVEQEPRLVLDMHTAKVTLGAARLAGQPGVSYARAAHRVLVRRTEADQNLEV